MAHYTFTRSTASASALTVNYSVAGTATSGSDYTALSGSVNIPANETTATVTVNPINDRLLEGDETVTLTVASGSDYNVGTPSSATGTITDDESAILSIASTSSVTEQDGAQNIGVT